MHAQCNSLNNWRHWASGDYKALAKRTRKSIARSRKLNLRRDLRWVALVNKREMVMKLSKHEEANKDVKIYVGRSNDLAQSYVLRSYTVHELRNQTGL